MEIFVEINFCSILFEVSKCGTHLRFCNYILWMINCSQIHHFLFKFPKVNDVMVGLTSSINSIDLPLSRDESSKRSLGACWSIIWLNRFHSKRKIRKIVIDAKAFQVSSRPNIRDAAPFVGLLMESLW